MNIYKTILGKTWNVKTRKLIKTDKKLVLNLSVR